MRELEARGAAGDGLIRHSGMLRQNEGWAKPTGRANARPMTGPRAHQQHRVKRWARRKRLYPPYVLDHPLSRMMTASMCGAIIAPQ